MPKKSKEQLAREAKERHEDLCRRAKDEANLPGITKLRFKVEQALKERMKAELRAGLS